MLRLISFRLELKASFNNVNFFRRKEQWLLFDSCRNWVSIVYSDFAFHDFTAPIPWDFAHYRGRWITRWLT